MQLGLPTERHFGSSLWQSLSLQGIRTQLRGMGKVLEIHVMHIVVVLKYPQILWHFSHLKVESLCTSLLNLAKDFASETALATHSSTLAWKIPWTEEPGRLQSMGSRRVGHDWATSLSLFTFMHWRRKWQPTPVFLPGESQGWRSLVGCHLWGRTELEMTEAT